MSNTRHTTPIPPPNGSIPQAPAIFVNAVRMEIQQITPTHVAIVISNAVVSAQIPLDADQLMRLAKNVTELAGKLEKVSGLTVPSVPGLFLP